MPQRIVVGPDGVRVFDVGPIGPAGPSGTNEVDLTNLALLSGGNKFYGLQDVQAQLPMFTLTDVSEGAELAIVSSVTDEETGAISHAYVGAKIDLTSLSPETGVVTTILPVEFEIVAGANTGRIHMMVPTTAVGAIRYMPVTFPDLKLSNMLSAYSETPGEGVLRGSIAIADPVVDLDATNKKYVDGRFNEANDMLKPMLIRSLETVGTDPRFQMCGDASDPGGWEKYMWTTPAPDDFVDGVWIRCYGVLFTETGLPVAPVDGDAVFSELFTWPEGSDPLAYGDWDIAEFARRATWSDALGRWVHELFWEHTSTAAMVDEAEDFVFNSIEIPVGVRFDSIALWIENDYDTEGHGRGRILVEVPPEMSTVSADGSTWIVIGELVLETTTDISTTTEPWHMGADLVRTFMEKMEIRNGGPTGAIMADPDAVVADLEADGDPFTDVAGNVWTPSPDAVVVPA